MVELRLLTEEAKQTRFDFVWQVEGCKVPILAQQEGELALRYSLANNLRMHGALDYGLANEL